MAAIRSLKQVASKLSADFSLTPVMATEIEFYLHGVSKLMSKEQVADAIRSAATAAGLNVASADSEKGDDQFEISLQPTRDIAHLAEDTARFKTLMTENFAPQGVQADFSAKPLPEQPGSGLHIHFHLEDVQGKNMFTRSGDEMDDPFSESLLHCLGGMLALMNPCMRFFVPTPESYARFTAQSNAPLTVSWGTNNRTVALRLPTKALNNKHIEHRVAGSDADVLSVLWAVLAGAHYGLAHKSDPGEPIYGDAALAQYNLAALAKNATEAEKYHAEAQPMLAPYIA